MNSMNGNNMNNVNSLIGDSKQSVVNSIQHIANTNNINHNINNILSSGNSNNSKHNSNSKNDSNILDNERNEFKMLGKFGKRLTRIFSSNRPNGYALLILVLMFFYVGVIFSKPIILSGIKNFRAINIPIAKRMADYKGISVMSPIRHNIANTVHKRVQDQLIQHLAANRSSSENYPCQNTLVPTIQNGGDLRNQFGLCDPTSIFNGLNGDTNQSVPFIDFVYPDHKVKLKDPKLDKLRESLIEQMENNFDYTLRTLFIGQDTLGAGADRINRYRWSSRVDIETRTYYGVINQMIAHFDVVVEEKYYGTPFNGGGDNCDQLAAAEPGDPTGKGIVVTNPDGSTSICGEVGVDCQPLGIVDQNGTVHPYGSEGYTQACGNDPYCGGNIGNVGQNNNPTCTSSTGLDLNCGFASGTGGYVGAMKPFNVRVKRGCASVNSGNPSATGIDPDGYTFNVVVRLVSIGSTFN